MNYINNLGEFDSLADVWKEYPHGGKEGDYVVINGVNVAWNKYTTNWGADTEMPDVNNEVNGDFLVKRDLRVGGEIINKDLKWIKEATVLNKGYFKTVDDLKRSYPAATAGSKAYVGSDYPYAIYLWDGKNAAWVDSGEYFDDSNRNKGYYKDVQRLKESHPVATEGSKAYVGENFPYAIYLWDTTTSTWQDSGVTGGEENVPLGDFYTKAETDEKLTTFIGGITSKPFYIRSRFLNRGGTVTESTAGTSCITDYIPYSDGDITIRGNSGDNVCLLHFYDENKKYISEIKGYEYKDILITLQREDIPAETRYIRATGMAENGISVNTNYIALFSQPTSVVEVVKNISPALEYGELNATGVNIVTTSDEAFFSTVRTTHFIISSDNIAVTYDRELFTAEIFWFDKDKNFISKNSPDEMDKRGYMFKVALQKVDKTRIESMPLLNISNALGIRKNKHTLLTWKRFSYAVQRVSCGASNAPFDALKESTEIVYDKGVILLPPNYSEDGEPVRLAIFCHGSSGFKFTSSNAGNYSSLCQYVASEGYAVMLVHGRTNESYNTYGDAVLDNMGTPQAMACYKSAYQWAYSNYNIKKECVVWAKSIGGVMMGNLASQKMGIPILACGGLAPTLDLFTSTLRIRPAIERMAYARDMAMEGDLIDFDDEGAENYYTKVSKEVWNEFFKQNAWRAIGYNPIWNDTIGVKPYDLLTLTYKHHQVATGQEFPEERQAFESLPKCLNVPLKIWAAPDDVNVDPRFADYLQQMCRLGGSYYELRWLPAGTGQHGATDLGKEVNGVMQSPISSVVTPKYGQESVEIPVAYIELIAWWRRFE